VQGDQSVEKLPPVCQSVDVALAVAAIDLFDRLDAAVVQADGVPDQPFEPIETVDHDGLKVVLFIVKFGERYLHVAKRRGQRKFVAVDFPESIFCLHENGVRRVGGKGRFANPFCPVNQHPGWRR
jgi:hypothetical protein